MQNLQTFIEKSYPVNSININLNNRLGLFGVLGILQDVAAIHGHHLGVGYQRMVEENSFWVLVQQTLNMKRWPLWQETVRVRTWVRKPAGIRILRDYELFVGDEKIGEGVSLFMLLDGTTHRPTQSPLVKAVEEHCSDHALPIKPQRVQVSEGALLSHQVQVRNTDLDMNNHVNNTKYTQWILDAIPLDLHKSTDLENFDINFIAETHLGDQVDIYIETNGKDGEAKVCGSVHGVRQSDGKVVFAASLEAAKK